MLSPTEFMFYDVYEAMEGDESDKDYLANIPLALLPKINYFKDPVHEARKNNAASEQYREEGNTAYKSGLLQKALVKYNIAMAYAPNESICLKLAYSNREYSIQEWYVKHTTLVCTCMKALVKYNIAMAYAPNESICLKLAYSNRSAVLFTAKEFEACQKDCIKALAIKCPTPAVLIEKLQKRISQAQNEQKKSNIPFQQDRIFFQYYAEEFFKLKSRNIDVPCASADVDFVTDSGIPKVIAKKDIAAGTLVGLDKAFVTWAPNETDEYFSCYYCRKLGLNLFPCSGCVTAMFCSEQCEESCMAEYHIDECKIAGFIHDIKPNKKWIVKVILKLINMCASWDELISMSYDYGYNRIKQSTASDIFNGENPSSILSFYNDRHFLEGALFNSAIGCAYYLHLLENLESFFPKEWEKKLLAMKAMARIMMYLTVFATSTTLPLVTKVITIDSIGLHSHGHWGLFPMVGKLKNSCMPNLQILAMNNTVGLVALEQIKAGTELTVSHILHWLDSKLNTNGRREKMFLNNNTICTCIVCSTSPEDRRKKTELTAAQKRAVAECFSLDDCRVFGISIKKCFEQIYKALACLHNIRFSEDYVKVYHMLKKLQLYVMYNKLQNSILSEDI